MLKLTEENISVYKYEIKGTRKKMRTKARKWQIFFKVNKN